MDPRGHAYPAVHTLVHVEVDRPVTEPYWPAGHRVQAADAAGANLPGRHTVTLVEPGGQAYPARQAAEHRDVVRPEETPYRPPAHGPLHVALVRDGVDPN